MFHRLIAATAFGLAASPALTATVAQTSAFFTLEAVGDVPAGIFITAFDPVLGTRVETDGALAFADSVSDGFTTSDTSEADFGDVSASASADTTGGGEPGTAFGEALVELPLFVENTTDDVLTITGLLDYDLSALVSIDDPVTDDAFAEVLLEFSILGDVIFSQEIFADVGSAADSAAGIFEIPLTLPGNFGADVLLRAESMAFATDVSPVPLPASLPLLAAALAGVAALRRRSA